MRFTVFTPTYNRAYIIDRLYQSLREQEFQDFEWLVVDDGSTDHTEEYFKKLLEKPMEMKVKYIKTKNGGKHRAINLGVKNAEGDLFYIVDSDDYLTKNALKIADIVEKTISKDRKSEYCGICGLRGTTDSQIMGTTFDGDYLDITALERPKNGISGEKAEIFYTSVLKKYPFPEFKNENFLTECVVWDKIAFDGYLMRYFNDIQVVCNYLSDGLTKQGNQLFQNNPKGYGLYLQQSDMYGKIRGIEKWNLYLGYYYINRDKLSISEIANNLNRKLIPFRLRLLGMQLFYKIYDK